MQFPNGELKGIIGSLITEYIYQINGQMRKEFLPNVNRELYHVDTMLAAARGEVDVVPHPYSLMNPKSNLTDGAFFYALTNHCLMLPWIQSSALSTYYKNNFSTDCWIFVILTIIMPLIWQIWSRRGLQGLYLGQVIYYLQSLDTGTFRRLPRVYKYFHVGMLMAVLLIRTMKSADLSASFSVQRMGPQINTLDDFLKSPLRLMVTQTQEKQLFGANLLPAELKDRLVFANLSTMRKLKDDFNTSYGYIVTSSYARILDLKQRYLTRPIFRVVDSPQLCTAPYF